MATAPSTQSRWTPSLPTNLTSLLLSPFAPTTPQQASAPASKTTHDAPKVAANPNLDTHERHQSILKRPILSAVRLNEGPDSGPPSPSRSAGSVMFAEPDTRSNSDDGSREGSIDGGKRLKRTTRPKTRFSLCHPPKESKVAQALHRRPRSLLQLHRLQANNRPVPALEVIPSANFSQRLTRAVTKVFKSKHILCAGDLVVLKAEKYSREEEDEEQEARDVVGLICKRDEDKTGNKMYIHMASGRAWDAYSTANGGYECSSTDEHGLTLTVRWVPKRGKDGSKVLNKDGHRRFNFSTISPSSRRHPVIASLSKTGLDINETYKMPEGAAATPLSTPKVDGTIMEDAMDDETGGKEYETDDQLREVISMTAIWVAFKEGWSPTYKFDDKSPCSAAPESPARRSVTSPVPTPPGSPAIIPIEKRSSIMSVGSGIIRRASLLKSSRSSVASGHEDNDFPSRNASVNLGKPGRARADSSSTVLVHRAASNRRKNREPTSSFRPDLVITNDLHETSNEDLARDFSHHGDPKKPSRSPLASPVETRATRSPAANPVVVKNEDASTASTGSEVAGGSSPSRVGDEEERSRSISLDHKNGHRESMAMMTDDETNSSSAAQGRTRGRGKPAGRKTGGGGWRRLLCGSSSSSS